MCLSGETCYQVTCVIIDITIIAKLYKHVKCPFVVHFVQVDSFVLYALSYTSTRCNEIFWKCYK